MIAGAVGAFEISGDKKMILYLDSKSVIVYPHKT